MTEPTLNQAGVDLAYLTDPIQELETETTDGGSGWVALEEDYRDQVRGRIGQEGISTFLALTARLASVLSRDAMRSVTELQIRQMASSAGFERARTGTRAEVLRAVFDAMHANSETINSPGDTYDPFAADGNVISGGSIVGDGSVDRLTVDEHGYSLIGFIPDTYALECDASGQTPGVAKFRERFNLTSTAAHPNNLKQAGAGLTVRGIYVLTERETRKYVRNPCFTDYTLTGANLTTLVGWKQNTGANLYTNLAIDLVNTFRIGVDETVAVAITVSGNETLTPDTSSTGGGIVPKFQRDNPMTYRIRVRRNSSSTGTVTIRLSSTVGSGGVSASVSLASITADTWTELKIAIGTGCWPASFGTGDVIPQIAISSLSGSCNLGNVILAQMIRVGKRQSVLDGRGGLGQYLAPVSGATPFAEGDRFEAVDTTGGTAAVHRWAFMVPEWGYMPSDNAGSETISDR